MAGGSQSAVANVADAPARSPDGGRRAAGGAGGRSLIAEPGSLLDITSPLPPRRARPRWREKF
ncbi:hypothetical protein RZS08_12705 [Arthrospira platensis SPKY1]|nr:hypothetical protein [Arthrospira platensis SPKY1]